MKLFLLLIFTCVALGNIRCEDAEINQQRAVRVRHMDHKRREPVTKDEIMQWIQQNNKKIVVSLCTVFVGLYGLIRYSDVLAKSINHGITFLRTNLIQARLRMNSISKSLGSWWTMPSKCEVPATPWDEKVKNQTTVKTVIDFIKINVRKLWIWFDTHDIKA